MYSSTHYWPFKKDSSWTKLWHQSRKSGNDTARSYLHSFFAWLLISLILYFIKPSFAVVFSLAYLGHLVLDILDSSPFYPLYPIKRFNWKGFIPYFSPAEIFFSIFLLFIFLII